MSELLSRLDTLIQERLANPDAGTSYVASLHQKGLNKILEKVGEEAVETLLAAKDAHDEAGRQALVAETADLWFHCLVMLAERGLDSQAVLQELARRFGVSGLDEKAARTAAH